MENGDNVSEEICPTKTGLPTRTVPFFAAMRDIQTRQRALVGRDVRPAKEPLRLCTEPSLGYPATEIAQVTQQNSGQLILVVSFMGLFGPGGALPQHYTQLIIDRSRHKDRALRDFLDLFNHRWLSLFYRAWEKHDFPSAFQTSHSLQEEDTLTQILWCLLGFGTGGQRRRLRLREHSLLHYSGHLSCPKPRQVALRAMLRDCFSIAVELLQFQGEWLAIPESEQTQLKQNTFGSGSNNRLGVDTVVGSRVWQVENRFRVRIGPLSAHEFATCSPSGTRLHELCALVRAYVGPQFEFDIQTVVRKAEVPSTTLSGNCRLGWNTWLGKWNKPSDADDATFLVDDQQTVRPL